LNGLTAGLVLVAVGVVMWLQVNHLLSHRDVLPTLLVALGGVLVADGAVRTMRPDESTNLWGRFIAGTALIVLGLIVLADAAAYWPLVLVAVGLALLLKAFARPSW